MDAAPANEQHLVSIPAWLQMPTLIDWAPPAPPQIIDIAAIMKAEKERMDNIQNMVNAQFFKNKCFFYKCKIIFLLVILN